MFQKSREDKFFWTNIELWREWGGGGGGGTVCQFFDATRFRGKIKACSYDPT